MSETGIPLFVVEDRLVEILTTEIENSVKQGVPYNNIELILYKVLSNIQAKKAQGYANEYLRMMENQKEKADE